MLKRFLPEVINCCEESVLSSRTLNFVRASSNLPASIEETPSFQIVSVSTIDISAIFDLFSRVLTKKELQLVFEKENKYSKHLTPALRIYMFKEPENRGRINVNITKRSRTWHVCPSSTVPNRSCRDRHAAKMSLKIV